MARSGDTAGDGSTAGWASIADKSRITDIDFAPVDVDVAPDAVGDEVVPEVALLDELARLRHIAALLLLQRLVDCRPGGVDSRLRIGRGDRVAGRSLLIVAFGEIVPSNELRGDLPSGAQEREYKWHKHGLFYRADRIASECTRALLPRCERESHRRSAFLIHEMAVPNVRHRPRPRCGPLPATSIEWHPRVPMKW